MVRLKNTTLTVTENLDLAISKVLYTPYDTVSDFAHQLVDLVIHTAIKKHLMSHLEHSLIHSIFSPIVYQILYANDKDVQSDMAKSPRESKNNF